MQTKQVAQMDRTIDPLEKRQAESFYKVMVAKGYDFEGIALIVKHMGGMLVEHAKSLGPSESEIN